MTTEQKLLMERYGVSVVHETFYLFGSFRYRRLEDALSYARTHTEGRAAAASDEKPDDVALSWRA